MIRAVNLSGLVCPGLTVAIWKEFQKLSVGDRLLVTLTYGLAAIDVGVLLRDSAEMTIHERGDGAYLFDIKRRTD
jgi:TusA-related sulfurtransferase